MKTEFTRQEVADIEHRSYETGVQIGQGMERRRIADLIREKTYDSEASHSLSWIMDASNVERDELISLIEGKDF